MPGCPDMVQGSTRCPEHTVKQDDSYRPNASARGYDSRWRKASRAFLLANPQCCVVGCDRASTDTDHIDGKGPRGPRGYDESNWRALCHQHHSAITAATTAAAKRNRG